MAGALSRLTRALIPILEGIRSAPLDDDSRDMLEVIVDDHGLEGENPPAWMIELLDDIQTKQTCKPRRSVPDGYPFGEMGLANLLIDIQKELFPLEVDDYGEDVSWPLPSFGVRVVIIRECRKPGVLIHIERM